MMKFEYNLSDKKRSSREGAVIIMKNFEAEKMYGLISKRVYSHK